MDLVEKYLGEGLKLPSLDSLKYKGPGEKRIKVKNLIDTAKAEGFNKVVMALKKVKIPTLDLEEFHDLVYGKGVDADDIENIFAMS